MRYPALAEERQKLRDQYLLRAIKKALAERPGHSMKCRDQLIGAARHAKNPSGYNNDGSTCLCECHDQLPYIQPKTA